VVLVRPYGTPMSLDPSRLFGPALRSTTAPNFSVSFLQVLGSSHPFISASWVGQSASNETLPRTALGMNQLPPRAAGMVCDGVAYTLLFSLLLLPTPDANRASTQRIGWVAVQTSHQCVPRKASGDMKQRLPGRASWFAYSTRRLKPDQPSAWSRDRDQDTNPFRPVFR